MSFLSPTWLLLLVPVAVLAAAYVVLQRRRRHHAVRFTNLELLESVAPSRPGWRRHLPAAAALAGLAALVFALAAPVRDHQVPRDEATVVLVVDTSASMAATDVEPSRLEAARAAAARFVDALPDGFDVGLVAFDASARLLAAPTDDHDEVQAAIASLELGEGTAAGDGLAVGVEAVARNLAANAAAAAPADDNAGDTPDEPTDDADDGPEVVPASIVLLSDGESTVGSPLEDATQAAVDLGVPVSTISYGTDEGVVVIQGERVRVPADTESMAAVAEATGGQAFTAGSAEQLQAVLDDIETRIGTETEQQEMDTAFIAAGLIAVIAAVGGSMLWNGRFL